MVQDGTIESTDCLDCRQQKSRALMKSDNEELADKQLVDEELVDGELVDEFAR